MTDDTGKMASRWTQGVKGWRACLMPLAVLSLCLISLLSGLTSWWPGQQNANDTAGTKQGVLRNGEASTPYVMQTPQGKLGQAASFDGTNQYIRFDNSLGNFHAADFTIHFWMKTASSRMEGVIGKRAICDHSNFWDIRTQAAGYLSLELDESRANYNFITTKRSINDNVFHHLAVVRRGTTASIYIDGILDVSGKTTGITNLSNSAEFIVGRSACTGVDGTHFFTGSLEKLAIMPRALSRKEIQTIVAGRNAVQAVGPK